jgi:hypothetical protein
VRFISRHAGYSIQVFEGRDQVVTDPQGYATLRALNRPVIADFEHSGLLDHELETALKTFTFSGLPEGVNPATRIGVFDTEAYAERFPKKDRDAMQVQIEERLLELQPRFPGDFIAVDTPHAEKPWGSYDEDSTEDVLKFQERLQIEPTRVRRYEQENQNRPEVVNAMTALEAQALKDAEEAIIVGA